MSLKDGKSGASQALEIFAQDSYYKDQLQGRTNCKAKTSGLVRIAHTIPSPRDFSQCIRLAL